MVRDCTGGVKPESPEARALLARLRAFCFAGSEDSARTVRAVRLIERGEFRAAPNARWSGFTAEQEIDAARSRFRWDARFHGGSARFFSVTDAYEDARGQIAIRAGGILPVKKITGPAFDRGELQRYLASVALCPAMVLNHPALEWSAAGPLTLQVRDAGAPSGAEVEATIGEDGSPLECRANRPRALGRATVLTPWLVRARDFRACDGFRVPGHTEAWWQLPEGPFQYYSSEIASFVALR